MKSVFAVFLVLLISGPSVAQLNFSAFPHTIRTFNVRSMSLGGATVSLSGKYSDEQINPAGIGVEGILRYSLGLQSFTRPLSLSYELTQLTGEYGFGKSAVGFSFQLLSSGELLTSIESPDQYTYKFNNQEVYSTVTYSYKLKNDLRLGVSLNYFYSSASSGTSISPSRTEPGNSWSLDLGLQYQFEKQFSNFFLRPSFGIALSDFGPPVNYSYSDMTQPLPIKLQAGTGVSITSKATYFNKHVIGLNLLQNASKIMARMERVTSGSETSSTPLNPFHALTNSWSAYEYFDGQQIVVSDPIEQIWWHTGIELIFLETIALRWGNEKAGKAEENLSYQSIGAGIDLFYITFDYAWVLDDKNRKNFLEGNWWQLTGRIPLDGSRPDTILNYIF